MSTITRLFSGSFLLAASASCGGLEGVNLFGPAQPSDCSPTNIFCMSAVSFTPTSRTVVVDEAAVWINESGVTHNVVFDTPAAALAVSVGAPGGNFQAPDKTSNHRKFAAAGSYAFHCSIHGTATSGMKGTVVVQ